MAIYNFEEPKKQKNKNTDNQKLCGIICVAVSVLALFCLITHFVPFIKNFLLGAFGLFCYPFFITALAIGFALINHKKYVMPKKYIVLICLSVTSVLCILQLILVKNTGLNFWQYLGVCYTQKTTAGGIVLGLLTGPILYILNRLGAYIIFSALSVIFIALTADYIRYLNKNENIKKVVKVVEQKCTAGNVTVKNLEDSVKKQIKQPAEKQPKQKVNLTLNAKEEQTPSAEEIAKRKLGLLASSRQDQEDNSRYFVTNTINEQTKKIVIDEPLKQNSENKLKEIQNNLQELKNRPGYSSYPISNRGLEGINGFQKFKASIDSSPNLIIHDSPEVNIISQQTNSQNNINEVNNDKTEEAVQLVEQELVEDNKTIIEPIESDVNESIAQELKETLPIHQEISSQEMLTPDEPTSDISLNNEPDADEIKQEPLAQTDDYNFNQDEYEDYGNLNQEDNEYNPNNINSLDVEDFSNNILKSLKNENNGDVVKHTSPNNMFNEEKPEVIEPIVPKAPINYVKPPIDLLTTQSMDLSLVSQDVVMKREELEMALDTFGIPAKVIGVVIGPAVTRYELEMPAGVSIRKLIALQEDIAYNLSSNGDIRIEAPIPGRRAVGIEVPNEKIATVALRDIIMSREFMESRTSLAIALGKDISGTVKTFSLVKVPHLLIAGTTGSGKSVCINSIILSLIYKYSPDEVKLILVDPKRVEFSMYNHLPHLLMPNVITDSEKALNALSWCVDEMERRFIVFANARCKNLEEYNESAEVLEGRAQKMPYIIFIIDELADLLMTAKKEAEDYICRILQKARAAGIHMILATQRPSVDVVTGKIKANLNARICFALMTSADSKTVLDQGGADKLLGKGDMLFMSSDTGVPKRIQGCFVTTKEIDDVVNFIKNNNGDFEFDAKTEQAIINPPKNDVVAQIDGDRASSDGFDALMPQVLKSVIENGHASISMIQRKFLVGFPRAARIIDQMEEAGFISPSDGSKSRSVYITMEEYDALYGDQ